MSWLDRVDGCVVELVPVVDESGLGVGDRKITSAIIQLRNLLVLPILLLLVLLSSGSDLLIWIVVRIVLILLILKLLLLLIGHVIRGVKLLPFDFCWLVFVIIV